MVDFLTPEQRSRVMSRIRATGTTPERYLEALLKAAGLRFRTHDRSLPGRPDFVFPRAKVAVLVNGDFWHGWRFPVWQHKLPEFWRSKIVGNRKRDRLNLARLRRLGWKPLRIWEHQVEADVAGCLRRVLEVLGKRDVDWERIQRALQRLPPLKRRNRLPKP
jgi:DNA mismatch endonuclease (patch repair protein)